MSETFPVAMLGHSFQTIMADEGSIAQEAASATSDSTTIKQRVLFRTRYLTGESIGALSGYIVTPVLTL
ncbi:MAG: hypothetical protein JSS49_03055 [Planctomycetes bacterium]|nr:hypothetical protein [Planctomycetota bacterium]